MTTPAVNNGNDIPAKPLRSALRSNGPKVTHNDVPSKSEKNHSTTPTADKSGRKVGGHAVVDRKDTALDFSRGSEQPGDSAIDGDSGTTLSDLKRQRASRRSTDYLLGPESSVAKSSTSRVGNGNVPSGDDEPRLRLTAPEFVAVEENRERSCCVVI